MMVALPERDREPPGDAFRRGQGEEFRPYALGSSREVHLWVEAGVSREERQVLSNDGETRTGGSDACEPALWELEPSGNASEPGEVCVFDPRSVLLVLRCHRPDPGPVAQLTIRHHFEELRTEPSIGAAPRNPHRNCWVLLNCW